MMKGESLKSLNGKYTFILQFDGNLVLYCGGRKLWETKTVSVDIYALYFQFNGNLVIRKKDLSVAWATNTVDFSANLLLIQDDGNVVIYNDNRATWATGTNSKCNKPGKCIDLLNLDVCIYFLNNGIAIYETKFLKQKYAFFLMKSIFKWKFSNQLTDNCPERL